MSIWSLGFPQVLQSSLISIFNLINILFMQQLTKFCQLFNLIDSQFQNQMFENLKQRIDRQNLNQIKKKQRYLEDQCQQKERKAPPKGVKRKIDKILNQLQNAESEDSLSDYEILDQEDISLAEQSIEYNSEPKKPTKFFLPLSSYMTPENKLKQFQKQLELSLEKFRLQGQFHQRQLKQVEEKYCLQIYHKEIQMEKLRIKLESRMRSGERVICLEKENSNLKKMIDDLQQKVNNFDTLRQQNNWLKQQIDQLRRELDLHKVTANLKQMTLVEQNDADELRKELQAQKSKSKIYENKIQKLQKENSLLKKQLQSSQLQNQYKLTEVKNQNQMFCKEVRMLRNQFTRVLSEKENMEQLYSTTIESLSKNIANQTFLIAKEKNTSIFQASNKQLIHGTERKSQQISLPQQRHQTLNLTYPENEQIKPQIRDFSHKQNQIQNQSPIRHESLPFQGLNRKARCQSVYPRKGEFSQKEKIIFLERKLKEANNKIVELIQQKIRMSRVQNNKYRI